MTARIVLLPGMGADARMYQALQAEFPSLKVPDWIEPLPEESLAEYAARFAEQFAGDPPEFLGGCSFGAMVAAEMAKSLKPKKLLLISSGLSRDELRGWVRFCLFLSRSVPGFLFRLSRIVPRVAGRLFGLTDPAQRELFQTMILETDSQFLRWACGAIRGWEGTVPEVSLARIHGSRDKIIRCPPLSEHVTLISQGDHLAVMSHAEEIAEWLGRVTGE